MKERLEPFAFFCAVAILGCAARPRPAITRPSPSMSIAELKTGCDRGNWAACEMLSTCYAIGSCFGNEPPVVYVDRRLSSSYVARACDLGHLDACAELNRIHFTGPEMALDWRPAFQTALSTCERGSSAGCRLLGDAYENGWGTDIDLEKAKAMERSAPWTRSNVAASPNHAPSTNQAAGQEMK
jgi:hypothetical protein